MNEKITRSMYLRQEGIVNTSKLNLPVVIIGAGGIGSMTIIQLMKMGISNLTIYDMDTVEEHNLPNSFFPLQFTGKNKAKAIASVCHLFTGLVPKFIEEEYKGTDLSQYQIVIAAPDNMETRRAIWNRVKHTNKKLYVDARMSAEFMDIYFIDPNDKKDVALYEKHTLNIKDEDTVEEACTERAIIYNTAGIGSFICNAVKRAVSGQENPARLMMDYKNFILQPIYTKERPVE